MRLSVIAEVLWLAALAMPGIATATWIAGAILIPFAVVLAASAGSLGIAGAEGALSRVALGLGLTALGAAPAAVLLVAARPLSAVALIPVVVAALVAAAALWFVLTCRRVWAPR